MGQGPQPPLPTGFEIRLVEWLERGKVALRIETLVRLADALGVAPGELVRKATPAPPKTGRPARTARRWSIPLRWTNSLLRHPTSAGAP